MSGYNPLNEQIKKQYEEALLHGKCLDEQTVRAAWNSINLFEKFTGHDDFKTFNADQAKAFKHWLEKQKNANGVLLSISTARSHLNSIRAFFEWLAIHPHYIRKVDGRAVQFLRLSDNANRAARASKERTPPTLQEIETTLKAMPNGTDIEKRDLALVAFTIMTTARDKALISLKRKDVDLKQRTVWQNPKHVDTKRRKPINTRFVRPAMPFAEDIVVEWIEYLDALGFTGEDPIFPKTLVEADPDKMAFQANGLSREHWATTQPVRDIFKQAFQAVGLPYYHPHLFRKTIVKWGLKNLNQYQFKALSQNIGHDHAMTTYNCYGGIPVDEQLEVIGSIGKNNIYLKDLATDDLLVELASRTNK